MCGIGFVVIGGYAAGLGDSNIHAAADCGNACGQVFLAKLHVQEHRGC